MNRPIRQGDILLIPTATVPKTAQPVQPRNGQHILAEGEATGHCHAVTGTDVDLLAVSDQVDRWLRVRSQDALLAHPDHRPAISLPDADYIIRRQREYSPQAIRYVAD